MFSGACNFVVACTQVGVCVWGVVGVINKNALVLYTQPEFQKRPSALNLLGHELLDINC